MAKRHLYEVKCELSDSEVRDSYVFHVVAPLGVTQIETMLIERFQGKRFPGDEGEDDLGDRVENVKIESIKRVVAIDFEIPESRH